MLGQGTGGNGALNDYVEAIVVSGTTVYVGGNFTDVDDNGFVRTNADYVAMWDGFDWHPLGSDGGSGGSLNGTVYALALSGTKLYVGGTFSNVKNGLQVLTAADSIAAWDIVSGHWSALGQGVAGQSDPVGGAPGRRRLEQFLEGPSGLPDIPRQVHRPAQTAA